jgi:hypothetical protein
MSDLLIDNYSRSWNHFQDFHKQKKSKPHRQLIFSKMAGMDQLREQVMDNHGKVYRSLTRIQDDLSIQGRVQLR